MNCQKAVATNEGKFFAETFVCSDCYSVALRMYEKAIKELTLVKILVKDSIRMAILQRKLQFKTPEQLREVSKADFLADLGRLVEAAQERNTQCQGQTIRSMGSTKQLALFQDANSSSDSAKPCLPDTKLEIK